MGCGALAAGTAAYWLTRRDSLPSGTKVLAFTSGAIDPAENGFQMRDKIEATALRNAERTGFDRLDLRSPEQGMFYKTLIAAGSALRDGAWLEDFAERKASDWRYVGLRRLPRLWRAALRCELLSRAGWSRARLALHTAHSYV